MSLLLIFSNLSFEHYVYIIDYLLLCVDTGGTLSLRALHKNNHLFFINFLVLLAILLLLAQPVLTREMSSCLFHDVLVTKNKTQSNW